MGLCMFRVCAEGCFPTSHDHMPTILSLASWLLAFCLIGWWPTINFSNERCCHTMPGTATRRSGNLAPENTNPSLSNPFLDLAHTTNHSTPSCRFFPPVTPHQCSYLSCPCTSSSPSCSLDLNRTNASCRRTVRVGLVLVSSRKSVPAPGQAHSCNLSLLSLRLNNTDPDE